MRFLATILLLIFSLIWYYFWYNNLNNILIVNQVDNYSNYSILIIMAWMFVFWVLFWKTLIKKEENIIKEKNIVEENNFIPEIKKETTLTYKNYDDDFEFIKSNIDKILYKKNTKTQDSMFLWVANRLKKQRKQNLTIIEGIWPKLEELLNINWIYSYKDLANSDILKIKNILKSAGKRYLMLHNPETWWKQALLADKENFKELKNYQNKLVKWVEK